MCQILMDLSPEPPLARLPSGKTHTELTHLVCPFKAVYYYIYIFYREPSCHQDFEPGLNPEKNYIVDSPPIDSSPSSNRNNIASNCNNSKGLRHLLHDGIFASSIMSLISVDG